MRTLVLSDISKQKILVNALLTGIFRFSDTLTFFFLSLLALYLSSLE